MGGGGSVPNYPDPNAVAARARIKATADSQVLSKQSVSFGTGSTVLGGLSNTTLDQYDKSVLGSTPTADVASASVAPKQVWQGKSFPVFGKSANAPSTDNGGSADLFKTYNDLMAFRAQQRLK